MFRSFSIIIGRSLQNLKMKVKGHCLGDVSDITRCIYYYSNSLQQF